MLVWSCRPGSMFGCLPFGTVMGNKILYVYKRGFLKDLLLQTFREDVKETTLKPKTEKVKTQSRSFPGLWQFWICKQWNTTERNIRL